MRHNQTGIRCTFASDTPVALPIDRTDQRVRPGCGWGRPADDGAVAVVPTFGGPHSPPTLSFLRKTILLVARGRFAFHASLAPLNQPRTAPLESPSANRFWGLRSLRCCALGEAVAGRRPSDCMKLSSRLVA